MNFLEFLGFFWKLIQNKGYYRIPKKPRDFKDFLPFQKKIIWFSKIPKIFGEIDEFLRIFGKLNVFFWIEGFFHNSDPKTLEKKT